MDARAKARRFLIYRAWKAADDPLVSAKDIARVTGLPRSTVTMVLLAMDLPHAGRAETRFAGPYRASVDQFMAGTGRRETRFAYFGD